MDVTGSSQGCRYCGRPLTAPVPGTIGGAPQVLCASCRASSSLDSLVGLGAFASGGIALKVPQAQASAQEPDHLVPPDPGVGADRVERAAHRTERDPDDVVIDLTDAAVARPSAERDADDVAEVEPGGVGGTGEAGTTTSPGAAPASGDDRDRTAPRRPERNPTIRDLTRGTSRSRSTPRRAEPLTPAPRPRPASDAAPDVRPSGGLLEPGRAAPDPAGDVVPGRGRRRATIIDLRDGAPSAVPHAPVGPQWSGTQEREALRALLEGAVGRGVHVLHDRRAPGCLSAIDHLVVAPSGIWVVDSMGFSGKVRASTGRRLRGRPSLHLGGRDRTPLLDDVGTRVQAVRSAVADIPEGRAPVRGALCFSDEDLGRGTAPSVLDGVLVTSRRHLLTALTGEAHLDGDRRAALLRALSERIPPIV